ncbi:MAG: ribonuclease III [Chloroflexota bacterium]|nr:ribonuclease III [Chloroflexota bacterium]
MTSEPDNSSQSSTFARLVKPFQRFLADQRDEPSLDAGPVQGVESQDSTPAPPADKLKDAERVDALQADLGLSFRDPACLREALTHRSYLNEINQAWPSNERLEFLGDAVLGLISTDFLFRRLPDLGEGELTNLRSALVRTDTLARFAQSINLGNYLLLGRGEEISQGRSRPAGLACVFEALLGALYIDGGYDAARTFAMGYIEPELLEVVDERRHKNAKSMLQEYVQGRMQQTPSYHLIEETGPDHAKTFTVEARLGDRILGRGVERSKRAAEQAAAEAGLTILLESVETEPTV